LPYSYDPRSYPSLVISLRFWEYFLKNKDKETIFYIETIFDNNLVIVNDLINTISFNLNNYNLKMCFDIGYANIFSKIKITKWIEKMNKNIRFVNLYNNDGKNNELNGLNNGKINMKKICSALEKYCPNAVWKIKTTEYEESIEWLIKNKYIKIRI